MGQPTVVSVDRWSLHTQGCSGITEVVHGATNSGLCRQVVLLYNQSLGQVLLYTYVCMCHGAGAKVGWIKEYCGLTSTM